MDERIARARRARARAEKAERRFRGFATRRLDPDEVRASRDFHLRHWMAVAQTAIQRDHRELYYGALSPAVEAALADHPQEELPAELQAAVLRDMAFMEGHLQAYREVLRLLEKAV
jgi:hypothetical protein